MPLFAHAYKYMLYAIGVGRYGPLRLFVHPTSGPTLPSAFGETTLEAPG